MPQQVKLCRYQWRPRLPWCKFVSQPQINPYAAPTATESIPPDARQVALNRLRAPSLGLLLMSVPWGFFGILWFVVLGLYEVARAMEWILLPPLASNRELLQSASALPSCLTAYGAWCMRRGVRYRWAIAAAILASIPILSPCIWMGLPFGIWALVVLRRRDVKSAFFTPASS